MFTNSEKTAHCDLSRVISEKENRGNLIFATRKQDQNKLSLFRQNRADGVEERGRDGGEQELRHDVQEDHHYVDRAGHEGGTRGDHSGRGGDISRRQSLSMRFIKC